MILVGNKSHTSNWIQWEIEKAKQLKLKIIAVKLSKKNISPPGLLNMGTVWVTSFERKRIVQAFES